MRQHPGGSVTLYDVASAAGVSTATVSRVVHGLDRVKDTTRARVLEVIAELGYVPDGAAQSLSRRRKDVIGLVCVERTSPQLQYDIEAMSLLFYDEILRGVEATIRDLGWSLMITYLNQDSESDLPRLMSLSGKVDGLLIGEGIVPPEIVARLAERVPVVIVAGNPKERVAEVATADNRTGAMALAEHLILTHGLRRFHFVDGPGNAPDAAERRRALTSVLRAHPDCQLVGSSPGLFSVASGAEAGELRRAAPELPDVVFCANDQMAIGVLQSLARAGITVPDQVAVVGFDDIFPGSLCDPALTTVHNPIRLLGERAATRLVDRIAKPDLRPRVESLPTELVLRSSCGCPPGTMIRQPLQRLRGRSVKATTFNGCALPAVGT